MSDGDGNRRSRAQASDSTNGSGDDSQHGPSTVQRPLEARITATSHLETVVQISEPHALTAGQQVLVHAWPAVYKSHDIALATVNADGTVSIAAPFGPVGRKCWVRPVPR